MAEVILHHYPQSPVAEKVRVVLGIKGLAWRSVQIPRIPPKPDLMPLTGGYRRTPVMQVGADVYCDSQCIVRELQRRFPDPTLFPGGADGMAWGVGQWTDGALFTDVVAVVLGHQAEALPADFAADRGRLYFGPDCDYVAMKQSLPERIARIRAQVGWMDDRMATGRRYMLGDAPGLPDAFCHYLIWFLRGRWSDGPALLSEFPHLEAWEARVRAIGHGKPTEMASAEALEIARGAEPAAEARADPLDPLGLEVGGRVAVAPDGDGGDPSVEGDLLALSRDEVVVVRGDDRVGRVAVHFPRVGYRIESR